MYRYDVGLSVNAGDRRDVADEIETKLVVERGVDGIPTADHEQRVAVRRCAHDRLCADIAAATRPVVDNELLAEALRQPLTHQTRDDVSRAGRCERNNQTHRPRWIGLRPRDARDDRQRGSACGQMQKISAGKVYVETPPPLTSFAHLLGAGRHRVGQVEAERLRSFEINDEFQFGRKLHREVGDGSALQYLVDISRGATEAVTKINSIAYEPAGFHVFAITVHSGQACSRGASSDPCSFPKSRDWTVVRPILRRFPF